MKYLMTIVFSSICLLGFGQWSELTTGTTNNLNAIQFVNENTGFSVGGNGTFLKTTNGGTSWTLKTFPSADDFKNVYFVNESTGFICSNNQLYKTTDGGENFTEITSELSLPSAPSGPMNQIKIYFNGNVGIITALWAPIAVLAIKTDDGGATWSELTAPGTGTLFGDAKFSIVNSSTLYSVKNDKHYKTTDGGVTWTTVRTLPAYLNASDNNFYMFNSDGRGYADLGAAGFMRITNDDSETIVSASGGSYPHSFSFLSADIGFSMKENKILKTTDGGTVFTQIHAFESITTDFRNWHLHFVDQFTGFVCGKGGKIYKMAAGTSVKSPEQLKSAFNIYPNPATDMLFLDYRSDISIVSVNIFDIAGRIVKVLDRDFDKIDISTLNSGMYWIEIQSLEGSFSEKIVIQ